ncbi:hypothetical protein [Actinoallomurus bryophytorum]|nr:hypothetical protein [Actinoallomurus bryophytorum]
MREIADHRSKESISGGLTAAALTGAAAVATAPVAEAQTIIVPCSTPALVSAITTANTRGTATLRLSANCTYTITSPVTATDGLPVITRNVTVIGGSRTTIRRDPAVATIFRIFEVAAGARLSVAGITILNGNSGAAASGGGILTNTNSILVLDRVTMSGNTGSAGGAVAVVAARATISRSVFTANSAINFAGGGIFIIGPSVLDLAASLVNANVAPSDGGGLNVQPGATANITQDTFSVNRSGGAGGGIAGLGRITLTRTLVERNQATVGGGITGNSRTTLIQSIIRNNVPDNCAPLNTIPGCVN